MDTHQSPQQIFDKAFEHDYNVLKNGFLSDMEKASKKLYAYNHFRGTYFECNELIPYPTMFFDELRVTYVHFWNLDPATMVGKVMEYLPEIRRISTKARDRVTTLIAHSPILNILQLPPWYRQIITEGLYDLTVEELIASEKAVLEFSDENVLGILALYHATQQLLDDLEDIYPKPKEEEEKEEQTDEIKEPGESNEYSNSQKVLFMHYLLTEAGMNPRKTNLSACARILHGLTGKRYTTMAKSDLYKLFCNPIDLSKPKQARKDLLFVRAQFETLDHPHIISQIDKDIRGLEE